MESWIDIINDDAADPNDDRIQLPPPTVIELNSTGNLIKEIRYRFDENNPDNVIRSETKFEIIDVKKKVSKAAENRSKYWKKFGACSNIPKGQLERGISTLREGSFPFDFNGRVGKKQKERKQQQLLADKQQQAQNKNSQRRTMQQIKEDEKQNARSGGSKPFGISSQSQQQQSQPLSKRTGYTAPGLRGRDGGGGVYTSVFEEDKKVEIKISNLPQWSEFRNVKELIDQFRRTHLRHQYIPKYKIRMIPSKRTLEEWHKAPKFYAHKLAEYERLAIVEFEDEETAQKAISTLDGHHYDSHILRVEKAKPRNM